MKKHIQKHYKKGLILLFVVFAIIGLRASGLGDFFTLDKIKENKDMLQDAVAENYVGFAAGYVIVYIIVAGFSIPGAAVLTLASGFLFGAVIGTIFVNIGATLGALMSFLVARFLLGNWVQKKYEKQLKKFNEEIDKNGKSYMLTLRFIPLFPFFLVNILAGVTKIPVKTFVWTTSVGIIPGSFVYAFAGQQLNTVESLKDVLSFEIFLAFVLLGLFALVPVFLKKIQSRRKEKS